MTLLVDESTAILYTILVDGKIMFEDVKDLSLDAHYFVINGGEFELGTEEKPHENKVVNPSVVVQYFSLWVDTNIQPVCSLPQ